MPQHPVLIFGAGATKACGGPLTDEILHDAFRERDNLMFPASLDVLDRFLREQFRVPEQLPARRKESYPSLPLLLSLLDTAIDRKHALGSDWTCDELRKVRLAAEAAVFLLIMHRLRTVKPLYHRLVERVAQQTGTAPWIVSLNYDVIADNAMIEASAQFEGEGRLPDYCCDVSTPAYVETPRWGHLLKIHGSMNWLYCPACHRLDVGISRSGYMMKVPSRALDLASLDEAYTSGYQCPECKVWMAPVMITPTHLKDYRNPHVAAVWYRAERLLQKADRAVFVGYSLPWDDVDVIYLLKRGLRAVPPERITVVEHSDPPGQPIGKHDAGRRYAAVFGEGLDWQPVGFSDWLDSPSAQFA